MSKLEAQLAALASMTKAQLRAEWHSVYDAAPPRISADLLRYGIAYRLQEKALGGLSRSARSALAREAATKGSGTLLKPGTRLVRSWQGRTILVSVEEDGAYLFEDQRYRSLSSIAREITGTTWSGPRFFGLTSASG